MKNISDNMLGIWKYCTWREKQPSGQKPQRVLPVWSFTESVPATMIYQYCVILVVPMNHSVPISSGIEKFYTFDQFLAILFLTMSLLLGVILAVFVGTHSRKGRQRRLFLLFMAGFILFQFSEAAMAVCPPQGRLLLWLILYFLCLFLESRVLFLFCRFLTGKESSDAFFVIIWIIEAVVYCAVALTRFPLIYVVSTDMTVLGPLGWLLLAESLGWMASGAVMLFRAGRKKGRYAFILGVFLFTVSLFFHHLVFLDYGTLIFPSGLLAACLCWKYSWVNRNYLGLFLDPLRGVVDNVPLLIAVVDTEGKFLSLEGNAPMVFRGKKMEHINDLMEFFTAAKATPCDTGLCASLEGCRFTALESGRIFLQKVEHPTHLIWSVRAVKYRRKKLAWVLSFRDVTEEEEDVQKAAEQEAAVTKSYERLKLYRKTGVYRDLEKEREALVKTVQEKVAALTEEIDSLLSSRSKSVRTNTLLKRLIYIARRGLGEIRLSLQQLKKIHREEIE
ncbi:MAG: hypothetical protein JW874_10780 [Spirochaetales bacterium]|nr:hypothetical protein [Spirochaetales bacterium]